MVVTAIYWMSSAMLVKTVGDMDDQHGCGKCRKVYGTIAAVDDKPTWMYSRRVLASIAELMRHYEELQT